MSTPPQKKQSVWEPRVFASHVAKLIKDSTKFVRKQQKQQKKKQQQNDQTSTNNNSNNNNNTNNKAEATLVQLLRSFHNNRDDVLQLVAAMRASNKLHNAVCGRLLNAHFGESNDLVCWWLFELYRRREPQCRLFVLQFVPALVWSLFVRAAKSKPISGIGGCLAAIYNAELDEQRLGRASSIIQTVQIPDMSRSSVFHLADGASRNNSNNSSSSSNNNSKVHTLTESALESHDTKDTTTPEQRYAIHAAVAAAEANGGAWLKHIQTITSETTRQLVRVSISKFGSVLSHLPLAAQQQFLIMCCKLSDSHAKRDVLKKLDADALAAMSWSWKWDDRVRKARVFLSPGTLIEFTRCVAFCLRQPKTRALAVHAARHVHARATEELNPDLLLATTCLLENIDEHGYH